MSEPFVTLFDHGAERPPRETRVPTLVILSFLVILASFVLVGSAVPAAHLAIIIGWLLFMLFGTTALLAAMSRMNAPLLAIATIRAVTVVAAFFIAIIGAVMILAWNRC